MTSEHPGQGPAGGPAGGGPGGQPTEEELRAALEDQMRRIHVDDVLVQTAVTLVNLAAHRLGLTSAPGEDAAADRDLGQAKTAIDAVRALLPLCPPEATGQLQPALSQLQVAYAREAQGSAGAQAPTPGQPPSGGTAAQPATESAPAEAPTRDDEERAKARAKIWTPPGA